MGDETKSCPYCESEHVPSTANFCPWCGLHFAVFNEANEREAIRKRLSDLERIVSKGAMLVEEMDGAGALEQRLSKLRQRADSFSARIISHNKMLYEMQQQISALESAVLEIGRMLRDNQPPTPTACDTCHGGQCDECRLNDWQSSEPAVSLVTIDYKDNETVAMEVNGKKFVPAQEASTPCDCEVCRQEYEKPKAEPRTALVALHRAFIGATASREKGG
jgi:hypothetical protein